SADARPRIPGYQPRMRDEPADRPGTQGFADTVRIYYRLLGSCGRAGGSQRRSSHPEAALSRRVEKRDFRVFAQGPIGNEGFRVALSPGAHLSFGVGMAEDGVPEELRAFIIRYIDS